MPLAASLRSGPSLRRWRRYCSPHGNACKWLVAFLGLVVVSGILDPVFVRHGPAVSPQVNLIFFVMNFGAGFASIYIIINAFVRGRERTHRSALQVKADLERADERLQQNEAKIRERMRTDPLTGIANRRFLDERATVGRYPSCWPTTTSSSRLTMTSAMTPATAYCAVLPKR